MPGISKEKVVRNTEIVLRRMGNWEFLVDIAKDYGITRERVRQIVEKAVGKEAAVRVPHGRRIDLSTLPTTISSIKQLAKELQVKPELAYVLCNLKNIRYRKGPIRGTRSARTKDVQVLKSLASTLDHTPSFVEFGKARGMHCNAVGTRWTGYRRRAQTRGMHRLYYFVGLEPRTAGGRGHIHATTRAEYKAKRCKDITVLKALGLHLGRVPVYRELVAARGDCIATIGFRWKRIIQQQRRYTSGVQRLYRLAGMKPGHKPKKYLPVTQKVEQSTMTTFSTVVRTEMQVRRVELTQELAALNTLMGLTPTPVTYNRPLGAFRNAIRSALKANPGLTAAQVTQQLATDGFTVPTTNKTTLASRVSCDIQKLTKAGEVVKLSHHRYKMA